MTASELNSIAKNWQKLCSKWQLGKISTTRGGINMLQKMLLLSFHEPKLNKLWLVIISMGFPIYPLSEIQAQVFHEPGYWQLPLIALKSVYPSDIDRDHGTTDVGKGTNLLGHLIYPLTCAEVVTIMFFKFRSSQRVLKKKTHFLSSKYDRKQSYSSLQEILTGIKGKG